MTKIRYAVSMLFVALFSASAVVVGQSVAAEAPQSTEVPTAGCVTTLDYDKMTEQERDRLFPD